MVGFIRNRMVFLATLARRRLSAGYHELIDWLLPFGSERREAAKRIYVLLPRLPLRGRAGRPSLEDDVRFVMRRNRKASDEGFHGLFTSPRSIQETRHDYLISDAKRPRAVLLVEGSAVCAKAGGHVAVAEAILKSLSPAYGFERLDVADASEVKGLSSYEFAFVCGSRRFARRIAKALPTRLVGRDPLSFVIRKHRIVFEKPLDPACMGVGAIPADCVVFVDQFIGASERTRLEGQNDAIVSLDTIGAEEDLDLRLSGGKPLVSNNLMFLRYLQQVRAVGADRLWLLDESGNGAFPMDCEPLLSSVPVHDLVLYKGQDMNPMRVVTLARGVGAPAPSGGFQKIRHPLVSIIIPVYNRDEEIVRLALSICRQRYPYLEAVFVLNGSPPETRKAVRRCVNELMKKRVLARVLEFEKSFGNATKPRDIGSFYANGQFLLYVDSDDFLADGFTDSWLDDGFEEGVIYYPTRIFHDFGRIMPPDFPWGMETGRLSPSQEDDILKTLEESGNVFCNSGMMISKKAFELTSGIDHTINYGEDYYLWLRSALLSGRARTHGGVVNITLHPDNNELFIGSYSEVQRVRETFREPLL